MKIAEAKRKLMELANGGFHSIEYSVDDHGEGRVTQKCKVYLPDLGFFEGSSWESALTQLEAVKNGAPKISEDLPISKPKTPGI
jgi:hypothetical protein